MRKKMNKVVGITIDTKSPKTKEKVYYYRTDENYKRGDNIRVSVPSGGNPKAIIVIGDSKKKFNKKLKELED